VHRTLRGYGNSVAAIVGTKSALIGLEFALSLQAMIGGRSRVLTAAVAIALLSVVCVSAVARAVSAGSVRQRTAFEQSIARYARIESATTRADVRSQMQEAEADLRPCVSQVRQFYGHEAALVDKSPTLAATFDTILMYGTEMRGEGWNADAALPAIQAGLVLGDNGNAGEAESYIARVVRPAVRIRVCSVIAKWDAEKYASADRPEAFRVLLRQPGLSPYQVTGTKLPGTFMGWGFPKSTAELMTSEMVHASARVKELNTVADGQFTSWLRQQGIYQLMRSSDREFVAVPA
jgi:hypothetical protein